jgi:two-component system, NtrC family, sensor histidine kinase AtoS
MWDFLVNSLRGRMILLSLIIVNVPIIVGGHLMKRSAEQSLLEEKEGKLAAMAALLDSRLEKGGYESILERRGALGKSRAEKIGVLNEELAAVTDEVAASSPGLGVGYYARDLDAILTYGPSAELGETVGRSIDLSHPGRDVMENNEFRVESGALVRGNIMNAMRPIERNGRVIGYIWANELTDNVEAQLKAMDRGITLSMLVGVVLSFLLIMALSEGTLKDVQKIVQGLRELRFDLSKRIRGLYGELGEIAGSINEMAGALAEAKNLSEHIMDGMADGIVAVDNSGKITAINAMAERLTGFTSRELMGEPYEKMFCQDPSFHSFLLDTLRTGRTHIGYESEIPVKHRMIWVSASTSRLKDHNGEVMGAVAVFRDLTERKRLEEQVNRANRLATLGELMAGVAHEIRNPLTSIKGLLQHFQASADNREWKTYLPVMLREVDRMNRIIETLLNFSRPGQADVSRTDVGKMLFDTLTLVKSRNDSKHVEFDVRVEDGLPAVELDGEQFKQVILNLAINSLQAMGESGSVRIEVGHCPEDDTVFFSFADSGPGIPDDIREKVLDPFFTTKPSGTGLGLAFAHRIVSDRGGRIIVGSSPAGGALIKIVIPRAYHEGHTSDDNRQDSYC